MDYERFSTIVEKQLEKCKAMLVSKGKEYANDDDCLINFKTAAMVTDGNMRTALAGYMVKHTISINAMLQSDKEFSEAQWNEKITDHMNYLLLLQGVLEEERDQKPQGTPVDTNVDVDMARIAALLRSLSYDERATSHLDNAACRYGKLGNCMNPDHYVWRA